MDGISLLDIAKVLTGSGAIALLGMVVSGRTGRQRDYDARRDEDLKSLRTERDEAKARVQVLEDENDRRRIEETRLRVLLLSHSIDPDSRPEGTQ